MFPQQRIRCSAMTCARGILKRGTDGTEVLARTLEAVDMPHDFAFREIDEQEHGDCVDAGGDRIAPRVYKG